MPWKLIGAASLFVGGVLASFVIGLVDPRRDPGDVNVAGDGNVIIARLPAITADCPEGWEDTSQYAEHTPVYRCEQGEKIVFLHPDGEWSHGWIGGPETWIEDEAKMPGWRP